MGRACSQNGIKYDFKRRLIENTRRRWKGNIRMDLKEGDVIMRKWFDSVKDRDYWRVL